VTATADDMRRAGVSPVNRADCLASARFAREATADGHQKLEWELPMYDALYAFGGRKATV
jgi:hypothetical protein